MNLQKIKEALDIGLSAVLAAGYTRYQENDAEAIREALAEFEKPADVEAIYFARLINDGVTVSLDEDAKLIQQYAESCHQRECAECPKNGNKPYLAVNEFYEDK